MPALSHLLYLHGFRSSPASFKARMLGRWRVEHAAQVHWLCPQLPPSPAQAWSLIRQLSDGWPAQTMAVIGSSLGGYYATALAEARGCRALVLNPAVDPARDLRSTPHVTCKRTSASRRSTTGRTNNSSSGRSTSTSCAPCTRQR